jgi:hypothetical protein
MSNKFDLNWSETFSYTSVKRFTVQVRVVSPLFFIRLKDTTFGERVQNLMQFRFRSYRGFYPRNQSKLVPFKLQTWPT